MTNSETSLNPNGGDGPWRSGIAPALDSLMVRILARDNVQRAWARVKSNQGAPGSDGMTLEDFPAYAREHWPEIRQSLLDGRYQPRPVRRVVIPKPQGKGERKLGVPCVVDRVIQQAILQILTPIFDPDFSESSYGSRPKRSAHGAINQVKGFIKAGCKYVVDLDLEKFFDTLDHDILMHRVARKVDDKVLLGLIGRYLRAGVCVGEHIHATEMGAPQGSPLSPLLSNILLDDLDQALECRGLRFVRYLDDLVILVTSKRAAHRVMAKVSRYLTVKLKLKVNRAKSRVIRISQLEYLGFRFQGLRIHCTNQVLRDFKHRWRSLPKAYAAIDFAQLGDLDGRTTAAD